MTIAEAQNIPLLQYMLTNPLAMVLLAFVILLLVVVVRMRKKDFG